VSITGPVANAVQVDPNDDGLSRSDAGIPHHSGRGVQLPGPTEKN
jgi:hypothetical protein